MTVTASAISGILVKAGFKRANRRGTSWSSGFETQQNASSVSVCYSSTDTEDEAIERIRKIAEVINSRSGKKYFAKPDDEKPAYICMVVAYDETDPRQNEERKAEAQEKLAADHPAAPVIADVKKALRTYSQYDADFYGFGYRVERLEEDTRLVRIRLVEAPGTTYEVDRDAQIAQTLANYARVVRKAGFEFQVRDEEMSVIVATAGEWDNAQQVREALLALREGVEADSPSASTRRAGDHSVFVMAFGNRVEVFYSGGEYKTKGRFGKGGWQRFPAVNSELLDLIVHELNA